MQILAKQYIQDDKRIYINAYRCIEPNSIELKKIINKYDLTLIMNNGREGNIRLSFECSPTYDFKNINFDKIKSEFLSVNKHLELNFYPYGYRF